MQKLITWIDIAVPCYGDYPIPSDNYYRKSLAARSCYTDRCTVFHLLGT